MAKPDIFAEYDWCEECGKVFCLLDELLKNIFGSVELTPGTSQLICSFIGFQ